LFIVVAVLESDLGSMAVMVAMMGLMSFVAGMPMKKLAMVCMVIALIGILAVISTPYRRQRFSTFLNPTKDCQAAGYQICESLKAIGSGGIFGKGLGKSVQAYGYLPEAANDSIFSIMAEKFGFIGISTIVGIYALIFARLKRIIDHAPNLFSRLMVTGILAWLSTQTIINIGAMVGLLPLKGITLPFISYGGTSLLFVSIALGVAFQISRYTSYGLPAAERGTRLYRSEFQNRSSRGRY
jgi:cell division protein FtsW